MKLSGLHDKFVITGVGLVCSLGKDNREVWENLKRGERILSTIRVGKEKIPVSTAVSKMSDADYTKYMSLDMCRLSTRLTKITVMAAKEAAQQSDLSAIDKKQIGVLVGTALSGTIFREEVCKSIWEGKRRASALIASRCVPNESVGAVCLELGIKGYNSIVSTFATSSIDALFGACLALNDDNMKAMIVVGAEEISEIIIEVYRKLGLLSREEQNPFLGVPFCRNAGIIPGEGAAAVVVEREMDALKRGANILGRIGEIITKPSPGGIRKSVALMEATMRECLLRKKNGSYYISASANGSPLGDKMEEIALRRITKIASAPVTSVKYSVGETLGASGLIQVISAINSIAESVIPPIKSFMKSPDGNGCELIIGSSKAMEISSVLINCFDLYGNLSSTLIEKYTN